MQAVKLREPGEYSVAAMQVAIVDDDPDALAEVEDFIAGLGYSTFPFPDAKSALAFVQSHAGPLIIVSDVCMPGMTGLELTRLLRSSDGGDPREVILVSAHTGFGEAVQALQYGVVDFLLKPLDLHNLGSTLQRAAARILQSREQQEYREKLDSLSEVLERARAVLRPVRPAPAESAADAHGGETAAPLSPMDANRRLAMIKLFQNSRRWRDRMFNACCGGDPCWEIVLFVLEQETLGRPVSVTSACHATAIPQTTALRKIDEMVADGLLARIPDPEDKRRILLRTTEACSQAAERYFDTIRKHIVSTLRLIQ